MNQLVFKQNNRAVTSSRNVAKDFNKGHREVLRSIDNLISNRVVQNSTDLFYETTYTHEQNKQRYRQYLMTKDGFTLLVMGFTGKQATDFKLAYINAFNQMEKELQQPRVLSDKEQLKASMRLSLETSEALEAHDERLTYLEEHMRIDGIQEKILQNKAKSIAIESLGGMHSNAYKKVSRKVFSGIWRDFNNHFQLPRYSELPRKKFEEGVKFLGLWQPNTSLRIEIDQLNRRQTEEVI